MFSFREYTKGDADKRVYFSHPMLTVDDAHIVLLKRDKVIRVRSMTYGVPEQFTRLLSQSGFNVSATYADWDAFIEALYKLPGKHTRIKPKSTGTSNVVSFNAQKVSRTEPGDNFTRQGGIEGDLIDKEDDSTSYIRNMIGIKSPTALDAETYEFELARAPFKPASIKNTQIIVDTREPESVYAKMREGRLAVASRGLDVGDIKIVNHLSRDHVIIERKTISDLYSSVISDDCRFHRQAERLESYRLEQAAQGVRVLIVWMVEGSERGTRMLYNTLPEVRQMDGVVNYLTAILDHKVISVYNLHHLASMTMKIAQGFFERELFYPARAKRGGDRVDLTKAERNTPHSSFAHDNTAGHGTQIPGIKLPPRERLVHILTGFPSINIRVAKALVESGLVLKDIINLSAADLIKFDGVGKILAEKIVQEFNS
jgi:hypothetical protein